MSSNRKRLPLLIFLLLSSLVCLLALWFAAGFLLGWPSFLERLGTPANDLERNEQIYLALYLGLHQQELELPAGNPDVNLDIQVEEGESAAVIVDRLQSVGLVNNGDLLRSYLRFRGYDRGIEVGRYPLSGAMTIRELAEALQAAETLDVRITIPEGWRMEQVAEAVSAALPHLSTDELLAVLRRKPEGYFFSDFLPDGATAEGFLFPDTYSLDPESTAEEVAAAMLENFASRMTEDLVAGFLAQGLSIHEAVTLASIVEREAVLSEERPLIASVFYNRLGLNMKLETDPTVQYALGRQPDGSWWKQGLTYDDLAVVSPFNTYQVEGLPPGPIANPGMDSLQAVAAPESSPYLYFRALCDGSGRHAFAVSYEEHLQNACP